MFITQKILLSIINSLLVKNSAFSTIRFPFVALSFASDFC